MVTFDGMKVVHSESLLIKNGVEAFIEISIEGTPLKLSMIFKPGENGNERTGEWTGIADRTRFTFTGWGSSLGTCTLEPAKFGEAGTSKLYFQLVNYGIGELNDAQFYILIGDSDAE